VPLSIEIYIASDDKLLLGIRFGKRNNPLRNLGGVREEVGTDDVALGGNEESNRCGLGIFNELIELRTRPCDTGNGSAEAREGLRRGK